jgi:hypothetical protein
VNSGHFTTNPTTNNNLWNWLSTLTCLLQYFLTGQYAWVVYLPPVRDWIWLLNCGNSVGPLQYSISIIIQYILRAHLTTKVQFPFGLSPQWWVDISGHMRKLSKPKLTIDSKTYLQYMVLCMAMQRFLFEYVRLWSQRAETTVSEIFAFSDRSNQAVELKNVWTNSMRR